MAKVCHFLSQNVSERSIDAFIYSIRMRKKYHISPVVATLHWLPVKFRVENLPPHI